LGLGSEGVGAVLDDGDVVLLGNLVDLLHLRHLARGRVRVRARVRKRVRARARARARFRARARARVRVGESMSHLILVTRGVS